MDFGILGRDLDSELSGLNAQKRFTAFGVLTAPFWKIVHTDFTRVSYASHTVFESL